MHRRKIQKVISLIVILVAIFSLSLSSFAEENEINNTSQANEVKPMTLKEQQDQVSSELSKANDELIYVEGELSSKMLNIQKIEDQISEYSQKLEEAKKNYISLQEQVTNSENELKVAQEKYDRRYKALQKRLVSLYKKGNGKYLDVILGSKSIIELLSKYYVVDSIISYDSKEINELYAEKQRITKNTNELKEKKEQLKSIKDDAESQTIILTNTKIILENEKASLDDSQKELLSQIDAYKKQQAEINNLIQYQISSSTYELRYAGGIMQWPTIQSAYITSPFGTRLHPIYGIMKLHKGIDIGGGVKIGDPIYAAADGVIIYSNYNQGGYGNMVMIDHGLDENGVKIITLYGHGNKLLKNVGDTVKKGDVIMELGTTGNSTGPHVHFEVRENGVAVDPKKYLSSFDSTNGIGNTMDTE